MATSALYTLVAMGTKTIQILIYSLITCSEIACSRRSDSGARAKNKASKRAGKKRGETGGESPLVFPALSLALVFARAPLSERLEQASSEIVG